MRRASASIPRPGSRAPRLPTASTATGRTPCPSRRPSPVGSACSSSTGATCRSSCSARRSSRSRSRSGAPAVLLVAITRAQRRRRPAAGGQGRERDERAQGDGEGHRARAPRRRPRPRSPPRRWSSATSCCWPPATRCPPTAGSSQASSLQIDESALTGESVPASKGVELPEGTDLAPGDQTDMAFMHTPVTHGSGVMIVTATGQRHRRSGRSPGCSRPRPASRRR